ncbi:MAG TPA: hypothetical protein VMV50_01295 [Candidatus Paceibacterota bacterium]|nr:hypothetical protein [Candidatus Paceibacterota bacterium]
MALIPNIPTSFVPRPDSTSRRRFNTSDLGSALGFVAYGAIGVVLAIAIGLFIYGHILDSVLAGKDVQLANARASIDSAKVESFLRLSDRLKAGEQLLANHIALSGFFDDLDAQLPVSVRISELSVATDDKGAVSVTGAGIAKDFNSLAAVSSALAADGRIKDAIFSDIAVNPQDGSVSFALAAALDPKLVAFSPSSATPAATPAATTTLP